ncbi:hypothetical protein [Geosporobacter subterraneus]|nr:hypothetical protein [Geosporobacter subterraneus]
MANNLDVCRIIGRNRHVASMVKREDAEFIVKACNSYFRLIQQLAEVRELISQVNLMFVDSNEKAPAGRQSEQGPEKNIVTCSISE